MKTIDMTSEAITKRLRRTEQLRKLSLSLIKAKPLSRDEAAQLRKRLRTKKLDTPKPTDIGTIEPGCLLRRV